MDRETSESYEGKIPGTTTVDGYSEEYRAYQLSKPRFIIPPLKENIALPEVPLSEIVGRLLALKLQPTLENDAGLEYLLRLSR